MNSPKPVPEAVRNACRQFESWRATREHPKSRIPGELWNLAAKLAKEYGVCRTAQALRLNVSSLNKRGELTRARPGRKKKAQSVPTFVEVLPEMKSAESELLVELEDGSGARMKIQLRGGAALDLASLTSSFWKGAS